MKKPLHIIKIGGNVIDNPNKLQQFLQDFAQVKGDKILVHGGGKIATELGEKMDMPQQMVEGRRITDAETLKLITMVYGGLINKNIVASLVETGNAAIGLSGADVGSITSTKRLAEPMDFGYVGDIQSVNVANISKLLEADFVPVFCAITHDGHGQLLNTNADTMASAIATAMSEKYDCFLYYCFEKKGVLEDVDDDTSVIPEITPASYEEMKAEGKIFKGMIPKLDNAFNAINKGVKEVYIMQAEDLSSIILIKKNNGTKITA